VCVSCCCIATHTLPLLPLNRGTLLCVRACTSPSLPPSPPYSDIDLVVTGLVQPSTLTGGFDAGDKRLVFTALERIATQLRR